MIFRRNPYDTYYTYVTPADVFGSVVVFLVLAAIVAVLAIYVGYIALIIFLGVGAVIGLAYALYVYIKCFIVAIASSTGVAASTPLKTTALRWFTIAKLASRDAFVENVSVARNALTKSHAYRILSFRKWMWIMVALATIVFGSMLIVAVVVLQVLLLFIALSVAVGILAALALLVLLVDAVYSVIAVIKSLGSAFAGKDNVFKSFAFSLSSGFCAIPGSVKRYYVTVISYMTGIFSEGLALGRRNVAFGSRYGLISIRRVALLVSAVTLVLAAILFDALLLIVLSVIFVLIFVANVLWMLVTTPIRLLRK